MTYLQPSLFDQEINIPQANKINSFYSEDVQGKRLTQKEKVFRAIATLGYASDRDISKFTGLSLTVVPDRRGSLLKKGVIEVHSSSIDKTTNKPVTFYKIRKVNK